MGRRGWTSANASGWVQIIRGPRPPSVQWPRVGQQFRQPAQQSQPQVHRHVQKVKTSGTRPLIDPSVKMTAAKERVEKLESAVAAMAGPEVDSLRAAHKRAQEAVKGVPVDVRIKECEAFLARAASHLEELDTKRATKCQNIESSRKRLAELMAQSQVIAPPVNEGEEEVQQLRGMVSQLQAQIDAMRSNPSRDNRPDGPVVKRQCRREEFVPQCDEEMEEWLAGRHADLQTALRVCQLMTAAAEDWHQLIQN